MQLTEEEFQNIMEYILHKHIILFPTQIINQAKKDGWITKSKLYEAREAIRKFKIFEVKSEVGLEVQNISRLYEEAISELQNKLKEKE